MCLSSLVSILWSLLLFPYWGSALSNVCVRVATAGDIVQLIESKSTTLESLAVCFDSVTREVSFRDYAPLTIPDGANVTIDCRQGSLNTWHPDRGVFVGENAMLTFENCRMSTFRDTEEALSVPEESNHITYPFGNNIRAFVGLMNTEIEQTCKLVDFTRILPTVAALGEGWKAVVGPIVKEGQAAASIHVDVRLGLFVPEGVQGITFVNKNATLWCAEDAISAQRIMQKAQAALEAQGPDTTNRPGILDSVGLGFSTGPPDLVLSPIQPGGVQSVQDAALPPEDDNGSNQKLIIGLAIGICVAFMIAAYCVLLLCRCRRARRAQQKAQSSAEKNEALPAASHDASSTEETGGTLQTMHSAAQYPASSPMSGLVSSGRMPQIREVDNDTTVTSLDDRSLVIESPTGATLSSSMVTSPAVALSADTAATAASTRSFSMRGQSTPSMPSSAATASEAGAWSDRGQGTLSEAYDSLSARSATDRSGSDHRSSSVNEATADGMAREEARREGEIEVSDIPGALASELQLFAVIGKGGYGTVYKGEWRGVEVAVKSMVFEGDLVGREETSARVAQEAAISESLNHANVVDTHAHDIHSVQDPFSIASLFKTPTSGSDDEQARPDGLVQVLRFVMVQEYCNGGTVAAAIADGMFCTGSMPLRWSPLMGILRDVAAGMRHVHAANICHGDLSPMNILLKYDDSVHASLQDALNACTVTSKVADFGLAVAVAATCSHVSNAARGTPFYTAPEVLKEHRLHKASDMYSFGVLMWELMRGTTVYIPRERQVATGSEDGASRGSHSSQLPQRLHGTGSSRLRRPAVPLQRNPDFPNLPSTVPLTYTLTMQACLSERRSERPTFAQITTILHDLCSEVARGNYINSLGLIQDTAAVQTMPQEAKPQTEITMRPPPRPISSIVSGASLLTPTVIPEETEEQLRERHSVDERASAAMEWIFNATPRQEAAVLATPDGQAPVSAQSTLANVGGAAAVANVSSAAAIANVVNAAHKDINPRADSAPRALHYRCISEIVLEDSVGLTQALVSAEGERLSDGGPSE